MGRYGSQLNYEDRRDVTAEVFIKLDQALRGIGRPEAARFDSDLKLQSFLRRTTEYLVMNENRRACRRNESAVADSNVIDLAIDLRANCEDQVADRDELMTGLEALCDADRRVMIFWAHELPELEAAARLEISTRQYRRRLKAAKTNLKEVITGGKGTNLNEELG